MTDPASLPPITADVTVNAPPVRAFDLFAGRIGAWWPRAYAIGASPMADLTIAPEPGGAWTETGADGATCQWGEVLTWEPPARLVLAWRIGADWAYHPDLLTTVTVTFRDLGDGRTQVCLTHDGIEAMGTGAPQVHATMSGPQGWGWVLSGLATTDSAAA